MRRPLLIAGATLAALGAAWTAGWFWGAGRVAAAVDARAEALAAQGVRLGWSERAVGGFPFGYEVRLTAPTLAAADGGWRLALPWTATRAPLFGATHAATTLAAEGVLEARAATPEGPAQVRLLLAQSGARVETPLAGPAALRLSAEALSLTLDGAQGGLHAARLALEDVTAALEGFADGGLRLDVAARSLFAATDEDEGRSETVIDAPAIGATADRPAGLSLAGLAAGEGGATIELRFDAARTASAQGAAASAGAGAVRLALGGGRLSYVLDVADPRADVALGGEAAGAARARRALATLDAPTAGSAAEQAYGATVALDGLTLDDALWRALDRQGRLARDPLSLRVELGGALSMGGAVIGPDGRPDVAVRTVELTTLQAEGWGLSAEATGALTIPPGAPTPQGRVSLRARGWEPMLATLVEAGVVPPTLAAEALATAERLADPDAAPGEFRAEIALRDGAVWANGRRVR